MTLKSTHTDDALLRLMSSDDQGAFMQLADGTNVWLDARSSIRFPASFSADARVVVNTNSDVNDIDKDASVRILEQLKMLQ